MAFRIDNSVVRGEIDNRTKGIVRGRIWLETWTEPMVLELAGNAHPDLAGCLLTFINSGPRYPHPGLDSLARIQRGAAGDITASRKARVFDVRLKEIGAITEPKGKPSERLANTFYLEWFGEIDGRVVIESADYALTISAPAWQLTDAENEQRARDVAQAMQNFLRKLTTRIEEHKRGQKDPEQDWDEHDYERLFRESDARADKYGELLDKYGDSDQADEKIAHEMGWDRKITQEEDAEKAHSIEDINRACEEALNEPAPEPAPHREGIDWIRTDDGDVRHPLQHRCYENALKLGRDVRSLGLGEHPDPSLTDLVAEFQIASVKLAGALSDLARGDDLHDPAFTVAALKRALGHLHKAQSGLEAVSPKNLLPGALIEETRRELFEIREGIIELMEHFRGQK